ncbi:MAG TPA: UDP-N-acetylglucosamine 2-epimerase (non-hydrolyzing) [Flavobacteriales bacterium]|nr:UDP-N-acetylglucosamine 2-epimerase (non-hydrolyzing) [Flavobacteriales bacterium]
MKKLKLLIVIGTRPNFIKVTQFRRLVADFPSVSMTMVHTGQHFDEKMADVFFRQFGMQPDFFLNIGPGSPTYQVAQIMLKLEIFLIEHKPDLVMVVGDVNSTLAAALCANKCGIKIAHLESGLRSGDMEMPEEINRILTDKISSFFFVTEPSGIHNLKQEGITNNVFMVGNTMIDTMLAFEKDIQGVDLQKAVSLSAANNIVLMTIHRPSNVDSEKGLKKLVALIQALAAKYQVVFPVHPRTRKNMESSGLLNGLEKNRNLVLCEPLDYFTFQKLITVASFVITDSGGIQEETTFRKVPCITLRNNTERPVTVEIGTNVLAHFDNEEIFRIIAEIESGAFKKGNVPDLWDGKATNRILKILSEQF